MKKFRKGEKNKSKDKEDISCMYYWGEQTKLLASSWDGNVRLFDDNQAEDEGSLKYKEEGGINHTMVRHKNSSVNYLDFKPNDQLSASCAEDGQIILFNFNSYRPEGVLKMNYPTGRQPSPIKICKFLEDTDLLVSADLDGNINFWCVSVHAHPKKNQLLVSIQDNHVADFGDQKTPPHFPIRALDYDKVDQCIYTGDEMGFMIKWDISKLIQKLDDYKLRNQMTNSNSVNNMNDNTQPQAPSSGDKGLNAINIEENDKKTASKTGPFITSFDETV